MKYTIRCTPQRNAELFFMAQGDIESGLRKIGANDPQTREIVDKIGAIEFTRAVNPLTQEDRLQKIRLELEGHDELRAIIFSVGDDCELINTRMEWC
jgi:hypothetical protein